METSLLKLLESSAKGHIFPGAASALDVVKEKSGIEPLDNILGGGLPRARFTLVTGNESSGKTYIAQRAMASFQERGLSVLYIDVEQSYDAGWFTKTGVDVDKLIVVQPSSGEMAVDVTAKALEEGVDLVVLDSLAYMMPATVIEKAAENMTIGSLARLLSPAIARWRYYNSKSVLFVVNQVRDVIGTPFHEERYPGGKSQRFAASLHLRVRRSGHFDENGRRAGFRMKVVIDKTKIPNVIPYDQIELIFRYDGTTDEIPTLVEQAIFKNIIRKEGAHYYIGDEKVFGKPRVETMLREDDGLRKTMSELIRNA